jgi:CheY-like chemotaxis protein
MIELEDGLAEEFLAGCAARLATIEADLIEIGKAGPENDAQELVNRIFQAVHSVGVAGLFGLTAIRDLAHEMENVLAPVRAREAACTPERAAVLLRATDRLQELISDPDTSNEADTAELMDALAGFEESPVSAAGLPRGDGRLRVLLVEDDFASRLLLQTFLSRYGECHVAVNGREAVDAFRSALDRGESYDLICMDIMMPEMDGREAARQVRGWKKPGAFSRRTARRSS